MIFGTFDIFHLGHRNFLKQARQKGDYLIIVIARDQTVEKIKKNKLLNNENNRLEAIKNSGLADKVILGDLRNKYQVIKKYKPDIICLGYDQEYFVDNLEKKLRQYKLDRTEVIRLKPFKANIYKTSIIKASFNYNLK